MKREEKGFEIISNWAQPRWNVLEKEEMYWQINLSQYLSAAEDWLCLTQQRGLAFRVVISSSETTNFRAQGLVQNLLA